MCCDIRVDKALDRVVDALLVFGELTADLVLLCGKDVLGFGLFAVEFFDVLVERFLAQIDAVVAFLLIDHQFVAFGCEFLSESVS